MEVNGWEMSSDGVYGFMSGLNGRTVAVNAFLSSRILRILTLFGSPILYFVGCSETHGTSRIWRH